MVTYKGFYLVFIQFMIWLFKALLSVW